MLRPIPQEIVYKGTISDLRISAVDGTAFLDNCSAITAYADNAHRVEIYDSKGARLVGIAKEAGSGETLGGELSTNGNVESGDLTGWSSIGEDLTLVVNSSTPITGSYSAEASTPSTSTTRRVANSLSPASSAGTVVKYNFNILAPGIVLNLFRLRINAGTSTYLPSIEASGDIQNINGYATLFDTTGIIEWEGFRSSSPYLIDDISVKQVLTPSTDGIIIVNAKGGATENFLTKDTGFSYNEASYTVIVKKLR